MNQLERLEETFKKSASAHHDHVRRFQNFVVELSRELMRQEKELEHRVKTSVRWEDRHIPISEPYESEKPATAVWGWIITINLKTAVVQTFIEVEVEPADEGGYDLINRHWHEDTAHVLDGTKAAEAILEWEIARHGRLQEELAEGKIVSARAGDEFLN